MKRKWVGFVLCSLLVVFVAVGSAWAGGGRPDKDFKDWFGQVAAGYSLASGDFKNIADDEWIFKGGATYWPSSWPVGIELNLGWADYDVKNDAIQRLNDAIADTGQTGSINGGGVENWSVSADVIWGPDTPGMVGFYLKAGIGTDYVRRQLTTRGLVYYPPTCDYWYWWCYPGGVGAGNLIATSDSSWNFAVDAGIGLTFERTSGSHFYIEVTYRSTFTDPEATDVIPIVLGYRW